MEMKELSLVRAIDLGVASDTVNHSILLQALKDNFGVVDVLLKWLMHIYPWDFVKLKLERILREMEGTV